ncbi:hypothetical protein C8Q77DRAFT_1102312 [Trametes polyzona]|nr:hypothetical protein C8Q77DRAFT_1102312 [Trametes polyzona]
MCWAVRLPFVSTQRHSPLSRSREPQTTSFSTVPWPCSEALELRKVLSAVLQDAKARGVETGAMVLATSTLATVNAPPSLGHLYQIITRRDPDDPSTRCDVEEATTAAEQMREAILRSLIFIGVPRTFISLGSLYDSFEDEVRGNLRTSSVRLATSENIEEIVGRGSAFGDTIYGPQRSTIEARFRTYHPDLVDIVSYLYGSSFAPLPGGDAVRGNLNRTLCSVIAIACLRSEGGVGALLHGHVLGLLRARNEPDQSDEDHWLASDEGVQWVIRSVDIILDAVKPELEKGTDG